MKKNLILIATLLLLGIVDAKPVSEQLARQVAVQFWNTYRLPTCKPVSTLDRVPISDLQHLYIFRNGEEGFVIVSSDDCVRPVLAYSFDSPFPTTLNPELRYWLNGYEAQISDAVKLELLAPNAQREWSDLTTGEVPPTPLCLTNIPALMSTRWDQGDPYNIFCPYDSAAHGRTVVGCVATAMAQIMKYWNHPSSGTDDHTYEYNGMQPYADFEHTTYHWDWMPNTLTMTTPRQQTEAVATISYHCGVAVNMMYGISAHGGSGAYTECGYWASACAHQAFSEYFKYRPIVEHHYRMHYSDSAWTAMIDQDLSEGCPMYYSGSDSAGGHAFVLDGADTQSRYHFNWGWSGYGDGFYTVDNLAPTSNGGIGGNATYTFNMNQAALFRIMPGPEHFDTIDVYDSICNNSNYFEFYEYTFRILNDTVVEALRNDTVFNIHVSVIARHNAYLDPNGGEGRKYPSMYCPATGFILPSCSFTKRDCEFLGWCLDRNGNDSLYQPNDTARIFTTRTFYAIWNDTVNTDPIDTTAINPTEADALVVWPNPTSDRLNIQLPNSTPSDILLIDAAGRTIFHKENASPSTEIDLSNCSNGVYLLQISTQTTIYKRQIIKE